MSDKSVTIIGGGLAGCEAAWQMARRGIDVIIYEMRPEKTTPAHHTDRLGELVCSNSFRSDDSHVAVGSLKNELRELESIVMISAEKARVPAGGAFAVDRAIFAEELTQAIESEPRIELRREEIGEIPDGRTILATGPLTSDTLATALQELFGRESLSFYDGIAPIVDVETMPEESYYALSRYGKGGGDDYLNVPLSKEEYLKLIEDLVSAEARAHLPEEAEPNFFEGCLPIEEMARRGIETPRYGPMKPVGLADPRTGREPYAVIQLRREDLSGRLFNLVGFQTQLSIPDQKRILRSIPAFGAAAFHRFGSAHRNSFIDSPQLLNPDLTTKAKPSLRIAGQIAGVEGYVESTACGLIAGLMTAIPNLAPPPVETVIGGLLRYVTGTSTRPFQPMKANWGVVSELDKGGKKKIRKAQKKELLAARSKEAIELYAAALPPRLPSPDHATT